MSGPRKNASADPFEELNTAAASVGVPVAVIAEARRATVRRCGAGCDSERAASYFWGVVRNSALRGHAPELGRRIVMRSMWQDLAEAGHSDDSIRRELSATFGERAVQAVDPCQAGTEWAAA